MPVVHALLDRGEDASTDNLKAGIPIAKTWYEYSEGMPRPQPGVHQVGPPKEMPKNTK